jgi:hypothetical protein
MRAASIEPTIVSCNAALSAYEKGAQWRKATGSLHPMPRPLLAPDAISRDAAVSGFAKSAAWEMVLEFL